MRKFRSILLAVAIVTLAMASSAFAQLGTPHEIYNYSHSQAGSYGPITVYTNTTGYNLMYTWDAEIDMTGSTVSPEYASLSFAWTDPTGPRTSDDEYGPNFLAVTHTCGVANAGLGYLTPPNHSSCSAVIVNGASLTFTVTANGTVPWVAHIVGLGY